MPKATAPACAASLANSTIRSDSRGLMMAMPFPCSALIAAKPPWKTSGFGPSPVIPSTPACTEPVMTAVEYSASLMLHFMFIAVPPTAAASTGILISCPNRAVDMIGAFTRCTVRRFSLMSASALTLLRNPMPVPTPPMPGTSPAQTTPLHTGHILHAPLNRSLAFAFTSAHSINKHLPILTFD